MRRREPLKKWVKRTRSGGMGLEGKDQAWVRRRPKPIMPKMGKQYPPVPREPKYAP